MRPYAVLLAWIFVLRSTYPCFGGEPKERMVLPHSDSVICIAFAPDGKTLVSSGDESIRLWDVASGKEKAPLTRGRSSAKAVAVSPDGKLLASGNWDTTVRLWDSANGAEIATLAGHTGPLLTVAFSPDGSLLASGGRDAKWEKAEVKLWDLRARTELASLPGVADPVGRLAFSPDGKTVAVGDIRGRVFLWDVASKQVRQRLKGRTYVSKVIWSHDGKMLILGGNDIQIWDPVRGKLIATLPVGDDTDSAFGLAITKDGKLLVSGSHRGNIRIWDIASREAKLTLKQAPPKAAPTVKPIGDLAKETADEVYCVALAPDDTLLAAGVGPTVRIWDIKTLLSTKTGAAEKPSK
jgi:WD40 repeat protein